MRTAVRMMVVGATLVALVNVVRLLQGDEGLVEGLLALVIVGSVAALLVMYRRQGALLSDPADRPAEGR